MPRYFFHLRNGAGLSRDEAGMLLADRRAVIEEALRSARYLMEASTDERPSHWAGWSLLVEEDGGEVVFVLPFSSVDAVSTERSAT